MWVCVGSGGGEREQNHIEVETAIRGDGEMGFHLLGGGGLEVAQRGQHDLRGFGPRGPDREFHA